MTLRAVVTASAYNAALMVKVLKIIGERSSKRLKQKQPAAEEPTVSK